MLARRCTRLILVLFPMVIGLIISSTIVSTGIGITGIENSETQETENLQTLRMDPDHLVGDREYTLSQDSQIGIMNPVRVKQTGFQVTDAVRARTDTGTNVIQNISIDENNNWFANYTEVEISNLKRLYGINGTFEDGVDPWTNYTIDGGLNTQLADYNSNGGYIVCKNTGEYKWASQHTWTHSLGSEVGWEQIVNNTEGKLDFTMTLDFRYATGPIDPDGDNAFPGVVGVFYQVASDGWYYPMETLVNSRDAWYTLSHAFTIPSAWSTFSIYVGLYLAGDITLNNNTDYDDDLLGLIDDTVHAQNLTLYLDNVEFTSVDVPSFENVELTFRAGVLSAPVTGTGVGTATISNPNYWTENPFQIEVTSNTTVAFTYTVTTLYHRYGNTSWTTDPSKHGVSYSINSGESAQLGFYSYISPSTEYENMTIDIEYPWDWENATIWDPFRNNITDLCTVTPGLIHVPNDELARVGWWEVDLQAPNYAKNISVQIQDTGNWSENTLFRSGNITRVQAEIGTTGTTPESGDYVNFTLYLPNNTLWISDSILSMSNGAANSSTWILGGANTTAGQWEVIVTWTNGTEIAFDNAVFDMYHTASLTPRESYVSTDVGLTFTNMLYYVDNDTGDYIVDSIASVVANWSSTTVTFQENPVHNWWEGDFDTSLIEGGSFVVIVNASIPYFDNVSCQFVIETTYTTTFDLPDVGGVPIELGLNEKYIVNVTYQFSNGTGITGATIDFAYTGPALGLGNTSPQYLGGGTYSFEVTALLTGDYVITVTATKNYYYSGEIKFRLIVGETGTDFVSLNGTADLLQFGGTYHLVLQYTNSTGSGLVGATVEVVDVSPITGLVHGSSTYEGNGYYSFDLTPTIVSTYTIVVKANLTNHVTRYYTFNLLVTQIPTVLIPDSSGATIAVDGNYTVQLTYEDELNNGILGANITLLDVPTGLSFVVVEIGGGLYNVTLIPSVSDVTSFQISFRANKTNYQTSSTSFSLFVQTIQTDLVIIQGGSESVLVTDSYTVTIAYIRTDTGANITSADISISAVPSTGFLPTIQNIGDVYQLSFLFDSSGIWQITLSANRSSFITAAVHLEVEVSPIGTTFIGFNGTADLVGFGDGYSLLVRYTNSTGDGISGALIDVAEITPGTGIIIGTTVDEGNGYYSILFVPTSATTYSIVIRANTTNHVAQYLTFSLVVIPIETTLTPQVTEVAIALDQNYTLLLSFIDEGNNPVTGAEISFVNPPSGLTYEIAEAGSGIYSVILTPNVIEATSFQISFRANLTNYQSSTAAFSLLVQVIPTELVILNGEASESILFMDEYSLTIAYRRTDTNENISLADITVFTTPTDGPQPTIECIGDVYYLTFVGNQAGIWQITINANKTNHVIGALHLELEVTQIDTNLNDITLVESLVYGREYNFTFSYTRSDSSGVIGSLVTVSGSAADWVSVADDSAGQYTLSLTPESVGSFEVSLTFNLEGFVPKTTTLEFDVEEETMTIVDLQGLTALEGDIAILSLRLVDSETGAPVSGAIVTYQLIVDLVPTSTEVLLESDSTQGLYSSNFIMPSYDSEAKIRIYIDMDNYHLETQGEYMELDVTPTASEFTTLTRTFTQYSPFILLAGILVTGYAGRRTYTRRKRRENIQALAIKRRFDDVRNMLGVVVLHRESGIPVYSRMIRGGFDDSLISAFITAISQFRSEFDVKQKEWVITPISDIIMAVRTQNLICAFITMGSPTKTQEARMIQFAKAVGFIFDSEYEEAPVLSIDEDAERMFGQLFDEMLDMHLHQKHKIVDTKGLPRGPKCLRTAISDLRAAEEFELEEMAEKMASCGLEEAKVYKIIMDAITNLHIVPLDGTNGSKPTPSPDMIDESEIVPIVEEDTIEEEEEAAPTDEDPSDDTPSEKDSFIDDVEALLVSKKEDRNGDDDVDNPERLDLS